MPLLTRDWSAVTKIDPGLSGTVRMIENFLQSIPTMDHIEPGRLVHKFDLSRDRTVELYRALEIARDRKIVKRSWGVLDPRMKCHAQGYWDRLSMIPGKLYDLGDEPFRRSDGQFIVVYRPPDAEDPDER